MANSTTDPGWISSLVVFVILFVLTLYKKKKQVGGMWKLPVTFAVEIQGKELKCSHCQHNQFVKREGLLTTSWVTFFHFAFLNESASCFICQNCKFAHWFLSPQEKIDVAQGLDRE